MAELGEKGWVSAKSRVKLPKLVFLIQQDVWFVENYVSGVAESVQWARSWIDHSSL